VADTSWQEDMTGRSRALLSLVAPKLADQTVKLAEELLDANEYGVAVELIADMLVEGAQVLSEGEASILRDLSMAMGLDRPAISQLLQDT
jgi:hypothetical protein